MLQDIVRSGLLALAICLPVEYSRWPSGINNNAAPTNVGAALFVFF